MTDLEPLLEHPSEEIKIEKNEEHYSKLNFNYKLILSKFRSRKFNRN